MKYTKEQKEQFLKNPFEVVLKTRNYRVCSASVICNIGQFIEDIRNQDKNKKRDLNSEKFANSVGHRPLKDCIAIEEKCEDFRGEEHYIVVAFLKWNTDKKESILEEVENKNQQKRTFTQKIELKRVIKEAKKLQEKLNKF